MTVSIVDTSIFCPIIGVPNMSGNRKQILAELKAKIRHREQLLLPATTILETGNHIGQNGNGSQRREAALRFVDQVTKALRGDIPFKTTSLLESDALIGLLATFPDWAGKSDARGKGSGLGDLTIFHEWMTLCEQFPLRRVYIWSQDEQLTAYDSHPPCV